MHAVVENVCSRGGMRPLCEMFPLVAGDTFPLVAGEKSFSGLCLPFSFLILNLFFKRLFLRERQKEGDRGSEVGSRLCTDSREPDMGLEPTNCEIMT